MKYESFTEIDSLIAEQQTMASKTLSRMLDIIENQPVSRCVKSIPKLKPSSSDIPLIYDEEDYNNNEENGDNNDEFLQLQRPDGPMVALRCPICQRFNFEDVFQFLDHLIDDEDITIYDNPEDREKIADDPALYLTFDYGFVLPSRYQYSVINSLIEYIKTKDIDIDDFLLLELPKSVLIKHGYREFCQQFLDESIWEELEEKDEEEDEKGEDIDPQETNNDEVNKLKHLKKMFTGSENEFQSLVKEVMLEIQEDDKDKELQDDYEDENIGIPDHDIDMPDEKIHVDFVTV